MAVPVRALPPTRPDKPAGAALPNATLPPSKPQAQASLRKDDKSRLLNDFHRNHPQPTRKTSLGESADSCCSTGASPQLLEPPPAAPPRRAKRDRSPSPASHQQQQRPRRGKKVRERDRLRPLTTIRPLPPPATEPCTPASSGHAPRHDEGQTLSHTRCEPTYTGPTT